MSDATKDLVDAIVKGDALGTENAFAHAVQSKISDKLDDMRVTVAKSMFATPEPEVSLEDTEVEAEQPEAEVEAVADADSEGGEIN